MIRRHSALLARVVVLLAVVAMWEALPRAGLVDPDLLPAFSDVARTVPVLLARPAIQSGLLLTAQEIAAGLLLAIPVGAVLGILTTESRWLGRVLDPLLFFFFSIPKSIFLPLTILVLGIGYWQKVAFAVLSTFLILTFNFAAAVRSVQAHHLLVARSYGASRAQIIRHVYIPSMLPILLEAIRVAVMFTITAVLLAEMYASRSGIGHEIVTWGENFQMRQLLAGVLMVSCAAVLVNEAIRRVERGSSAWRT
jgi:ABC-type nitrate/sulfonate/bicarbonate transport system permease component